VDYIPTAQLPAVGGRAFSASQYLEQSILSLYRVTVIPLPAT